MNIDKSLQKQLGKKFKDIEKEANKAADRESTPERKAKAFAKVLRKHGVEDINENELKRQFGG